MKMKIKRESIRKAVAGILAFIVGISIAIVTIIPLLIYLNISNRETINAFNSFSEYQKQRSSESIDIALIGETPYIRNTGSVPLTIVLAVIDNGYGCGNRTSILKTNITMKQGDTIANISSYGASIICYIMTTRGNIFPIKDRLYGLLAAMSPSTLFNESNARFAQDLSLGPNDLGNYSIGNLNCNQNGYLKIWDRSNSGYDRDLISVFSSQGDPNPVRMSEGCIRVLLRNAVNLGASVYAIAIYYKIVGFYKTNKFIGGVNISLIYSSNNAIKYSGYSTADGWTPPFRDKMVIYEGYVLIPMRDAPAGLYDLEIRFGIYDSKGNVNIRIGIEYIAIVGATLVR
ncbi:MAG: hypothetical protein ACO2O0_00630 [Desulfurococcales archaeon]|jgi:hypothetical protein